MDTQHIQIPTTQFIGQGKYPWLIQGRVPGDEKDSVRLVLADSEQLAREAFRDSILEQADLSEEEITSTAEAYGSDIIYSMTLKLV
ncbi:hypothetical protein [Aquipseudomonas alcaligenes]|uniref:Uncharacterized protein n=1 Tax=Aquipseudomonas alcaligenes TaxID=43263 RepID=A0A1N6X8E6_AQUAC|nr:hypothetical protein [Pseudomonas alcaligenes]SIQ98596.1 hypothetical protein SAMN05878282_11220 [Pseudomonas alcaligenes]